MLSCWVISEGHAGMENQAIGLATTMGLNYTVKRVKPRRPWVWLPSGAWPAPLKALSQESDAIIPPWPDIMISSGRRSVPYSLYAGRASGGKMFRIHIQNPQCRLDRLDLVIAPEHDHLAGPNVVSTLGALHQVTAERLERDGQGFEDLFSDLQRPLVGVLIGGSSSSYRMDKEAMSGLVGRLIRFSDEGKGLVITPSRRTGQETIDLLHKSLTPLGAEICDPRGPNPYFAILNQADFLIVTSDSTSMTSEAVSTGKPVYVYDLPGGNRKFKEFHQKLRRGGYAKPLGDQLKPYDYEPLDETRRVASIALERYEEWQN